MSAQPASVGLRLICAEGHQWDQRFPVAEACPVPYSALRVAAADSLIDYCPACGKKASWAQTWLVTLGSAELQRPVDPAC